MDIVGLFTKFSDESQLFASKQFDPLDLTSQDFSKAAELFLGVLKEMEERMWCIAWSDLEGCLPNTPTTVKVRYYTHGGVLFYENSTTQQKLWYRTELNSSKMNCCDQL